MDEASPNALPLPICLYCTALTPDSMLPLLLVYTSEYTINTSLYPTLLYPPPPIAHKPLLSKIHLAPDAIGQSSFPLSPPFPP